MPRDEAVQSGVKPVYLPPYDHRPCFHRFSSTSAHQASQYGIDSLNQSKPPSLFEYPDLQRMLYTARESAKRSTGTVCGLLEGYSGAGFTRGWRMG